MPGVRSLPRLVAMEVRVGVIMILSSLTLLGASVIHFGLKIPMGAGTISDPFFDAAVPEAILGFVVAAGAAAAILRWPRSRAISLGTTLVTLLAVIYGLTVTLRGGRQGDVAYHLTLLLALLVTVGVLLGGRTRERLAGPMD